jgi:hypothetical protein
MAKTATVAKPAMIPATAGKRFVKLCSIQPVSGRRNCVRTIAAASLPSAFRALSFPLSGGAHKTDAKVGNDSANDEAAERR